VIGLTAEAQQKKHPSQNARQWDEPTFLAEMESRHGPEVAVVAKKLLDWAKSSTSRIWWGRGLKEGSFYPMFSYNGVDHYTFSVWTYGRIDIQFQFMRARPPFDFESKRIELIKRLNLIPNVSLPLDAINRRPSIPLALLKEETTLKLILETFDWVIEEIKRL